ncbi:M28 family metallopeptidase [Senegalia massiliensis]|nr:M28 family metallopeptidase [Senegalia massiliensis]
MDRKNRKKLILIFILIYLIVTLMGCSNTNNLKFNEDNAYNHIKELSSDEYEGRLPGAEGHRKASEYIANEFREMGLAPIHKRNEYFQEFQDYSPILEEESTFQVIDKNGNIAHEYSIRDDYTELPVNNTVGGLIEGNATIVKSLDEIEENSKIILSSKTFYNHIDIEKLKSLGVNLVISPSKDNSEKKFLKTVITDGKTDDTEESQLIRILVKSDVFSELVKYTKEGYTIKFNMDLNVKKVDMRNVIGYIPAKDKETEEALIITAHYDHVGYDADGKVFNGALDNASGIGMLLEIARSIKESNISPKKNIVFVAFDGEESGLKGSTYYTRSRPFDLIGSKIINLDMIGSKENLDLYIDYFPNSQTSKDLAKEIKDKWGEDLKLNPSASSDHAVFGEKDIPSITLNHPSMELIHTYSDDIDNIDKERLKQPGELVLWITDYYGVKAKDLINRSISDTQNKNIYILIVSLFFIIFVFLLLLKYRKKKGKPILTIILLIVIMILILFYNTFYEYEQYGVTRMINTDKYKGKPWKDTENITKAQGIYDSDFYENINIVINDNKNIANLTINKKGELSDREELNLDNISSEDIKILDNKVYFINKNTLSKINDRNEVEKIKDNIIGFDVLRKGKTPYIIASDGKRLYLINEGSVREKVVSGIESIKAKEDRNKNIHILLEREQDSNTELLYLYSNSNEEIGEIKSIGKIDKKNDIQFGIDIGKGYIFTNDKKTIKYGTFNLGSRSSTIGSFKELELTGNSGIKVDKDINLTINKDMDKDGEISLVAKGKDKNNVSYIFLRNLYNGRVTEEKLIYKKDKVNIKDLQILDSSNYSYVFWMEGKGNNYTLKSSSSDSQFGNDEKKVDFFIKLGNIIQNIIMMPVFLVSRMYLVLPGLIVLGIYRLLRKENSKYLKVVVFSSLIINILFEIISMRENYVFGYSMEYIIVPIIIAICALIITFSYLKETNNKALLKTFVIFTIINMILLSTLYAPYSLEWGVERGQLNEQNLFK